MSLEIDMNTLMNADSTVNGLVDGIYYMHPPDNTSLDNSFIIFNYELIDDISCLETNNIMDIYKHEIIIEAPDTVTASNITLAVRDYLDNYTATATFREIKLITDLRGLDLEKEQYRNMLEYRIIYQS